ncbi:hypothetical protein J2X47_001709 [Sphingomonas sp. BE270]|jgi:hypothetical protein|nr:hypothetical protein [Sphingomonas sp. BE270]OYU91331.1 MAG: hypothetical protein CFE29_00035 [Bradyrhizobiaceae bacterium PARB1]
MGMSVPSSNELREAERQIEWVLAHPRMSPWLKDALRSAIDQDPIQIMNDLEVLRHVLSARCEASVRLYLEAPDASSSARADT